MATDDKLITDADIVAALETAGLLSTTTGVLKAGDTMTGDLVIDMNNPRIVLKDSSGAPADTDADITNLNGVLLVRSRANDDSNNFTIINVDLASGVLSLDGNTSVQVPAISGANQAAQVTAYDAALGQLAIGGIEMGDTGWRDVSGELLNGWAASSVLLRRVGSTCTMVLQGLDPALQTNTVFYTFSTGFRVRPLDDTQGRNRAWFPIATQTTADTPDAWVHVTGSNGANVETAEVSSSMFGQFSWSTGDDWPVALPGIEAV
jgi:hypothetical protein